MNKESYLIVIRAINKAAEINSKALKEYLEKRKKILIIKEAAAEKSTITPLNVKTYDICDGNLSQLMRMIETMQLSKN